MPDPKPDTARSPAKSKIIRSQRIVPTTEQQSQQSSDSGSAGPDRSPLPRSHTPGHLSAKSNDAGSTSGSPISAAAALAARRVPSDLSVRQRSQSASLAGTSPRPSGSSKQRRGTTTDDSTATTTDVDERLASYGRRGGGSMRSTSAMAGGTASWVAARGSSSTSSLSAGANTLSMTVSRPLTSTSRPPRGQHTRFPPLQKGPGSAKEDGEDEDDDDEEDDVPAAPASGMYWSRAPTSGVPVPCLRAHATAAIGSSVYVFGGCDARSCFNDVYVLDADSFHWWRPHVVGDVPTPLRAMTCTAVGKRLVVFGGGDGPAYYNDVHVLDTVNFRWSRPRIVPDRERGVPSKRRAHTACLYRNAIYIFGGGDGVRALNDVWRLDVSDVTRMTWKLVSPPDNGTATTTTSKKTVRPRPRGYHTANMVGSKLIVYGGSDGSECFYDVWVFDVEDHIWRHVETPVKYRRLSHTATIVGSYLFVIGGHDGNAYADDILLLNLVAMTWDRRKAYGRKPSGRGYHGALLYDSRLLVIGGFDGTDVFRDVVFLELAVHAYYSQISHFTIEV